MKQLINKRILVGITGGIAAYKSADYIRRLRDAGAEVRVVMTAAAKEFITPLTMQAVSANPVADDLLDTEAEAAMGHIQLARWADAVVIAPASADVIARICQGQANDLLTTLCLATTAPIALAPAMNQHMWSDAATQANIQTLSQRGMAIWGPDAGEQACGDVGMGRMLEPLALVEATAQLFKIDLFTGVHITVTAGPTQESIDPVRYLTNHSSGKMGYAIAQAAQELGAQVTLISGPTHLQVPDRVNMIPVISAQEMYDAAMTVVGNSHIFIATAAVADYRCETVATQKIAKDTESLTLKLVTNPDIIAAVGRLPTPPFLVGFAAQTHDVVDKARDKLTQKGLHMIAANEVGSADQGFNADTNALTVITKDNCVELPLAMKSQLARDLLTLVHQEYQTYAQHRS